MVARETTCCIVGGGPAGVMLGLLLARQGVEVLVLEKHADFLRDFRGDTVHPSTLRIMEELGFSDEFLRLPHTKMTQVTMEMPEGSVTFADFSKLPGPFRYVAFMPQWDFLNFLVDKARHFSNFELLMRAEVTAIIEEADRGVVGVRAETPEGPLEVRSELVVAADGRHSVVRRGAGLEPIASSAPIDVLWFRLTRLPEETAPFFRAGPGYVVVCINRGDYWQVAYVILKGAFATVQSSGLEELRRNIAEILPPLVDRVAEIREWDQVKLLSVRVDRLRQWYRPGLLCIGDAAHAMSPTGGVGINLAIQDAVAAANILGPVLRRHRRHSIRDLRRVQRRRELPTRLTQAFQVRVLRGLYPDGSTGGQKRPPIIKAFRCLPVLRRLAAYFIGIGIRSEHVRE
jgi:2-polyprenyl-6-methoxyphenol hydroxylase-like FAD-dependent oxidoreductase